LTENVAGIIADIASRTEGKRQCDLHDTVSKCNEHAASPTNEEVTMDNELRGKRQSPRSLRIDPDLRCQRVYPKEGTKRAMSELQTVGLKLTKDQAVRMALALLAASLQWEAIDLTAWRFEQRQSDGTYKVTVTAMEGAIAPTTDAPRRTRPRTRRVPANVITL
jgi:hypothetical protein